MSFQSKTKEEKLAIVAHPDTTPDVLHEAMQDNRHDVRLGASKHPNTQLKSLLIGLKDPSGLVVKQSIGHKNMDRNAALKYLQNLPRVPSSAGNQVDVSMGTGKLRNLRSLLENHPNQAMSNQDLKKAGIRPEDFGIGHLKTQKGLSFADVDSHIKSIPTMKFNTSSSLKGTQGISRKTAEEMHKDNFNVDSGHPEFHDKLKAHMAAFDPEDHGWSSPTHEQRHNDEVSKVFRLDLTPEHRELLKQHGLDDFFSSVNNGSQVSRHPAGDNTVGWVRYTSKPDGYHIDELQSDFESDIVPKGHKQIDDAVTEGQFPAHVGEAMKQQMSEAYSDDKRKKMLELLFGKAHVNNVVHEAFLQHLRNNGEAGKKVHLWSAQPRAEMNEDFNPEEPIPVSMQVAYDQYPQKMGYQPATYGELHTQDNPDLHGKKTWGHELKKREFTPEGFQRIIDDMKAALAASNGLLTDDVMDIKNDLDHMIYNYPAALSSDQIRDIYSFRFPEIMDSRVVGSENMPTDVLLDMAKDSDYRRRISDAVNFDRPDLFRAFLDSKDENLADMAIGKTTNPENLQYVFDHGNDGDKTVAARSKWLPQDLIIKAAQDPKLHEDVARNLNAPKDILDHFIDSHSRESSGGLDIHQAVAGNKNTSVETLRKILDKTDWYDEYTMHKVASHPNADDTIVDSIMNTTANQPYEYINTAVLRNPKISNEAIDRHTATLGLKNGWNEIARRKNLSPQLLEKVVSRFSANPHDTNLLYSLGANTSLTTDQMDHVYFNIPPANRAYFIQGERGKAGFSDKIINDAVTSAEPSLIDRAAKMSLSQEQRQKLINNPSMTVDVAVTMSGKKDMDAKGLHDILNWADSSKSGRDMVYYNVLNNPNSDESHLRRGLTDPSSIVKNYAYASRHFQDKHIQEMLDKNDHPLEIAAALERVQQLPSKPLLMQLARHPDQRIATHATERRNSNIDAEVLGEALKHNSGPVREKALKHTNMIPELATKHFDDEYSPVQTAAFQVRGIPASAYRAQIDNPKIDNEIKQAFIVPKLRESYEYEDPDKVRTKLNTGKLRMARDMAEANGWVHKKELEKVGLNPQALGLKMDAKGHVSKTDIEKSIEEAPTMEFGWSHGKDWIGAQRHSQVPSKVFQLNITQDHINKMNEAGVLRTFKQVHEKTHAYAHPAAAHTGIGWVRYTEGAKPEDGIHIDEVQSDFGQNFSKMLEQEGVNGDHLKKINEIVFQNKLPNRVIHESFLQHLRNKGEPVGNDVEIWKPEAKKTISLGDQNKPVPVHMNQTYGEQPPKMGYKASTYGSLPHQDNPEHQGKATWKHKLLKVETLFA